MKKLFTLLTSAVLAMSLVACGTDTSAGAPAEEAAPAETEAAAAEPAAEAPAEGERQIATGVTPKVGYLAPTLQTEFMIGIGNDLEAACKENGWEYTAISFDNDSGKAVTAIENMVTGGTNVILAMVSDSSCDDALKAAQDAGVVIVEAGVVTDVYDIAINVDQYHIGEMIGEMAGDWVNANRDGKANYVVYTTYQNSDMQNRGQGIQDKFAELCPDANLLEVVDIGKDVVGSGTSTTETMLQKYPDIDTILCYGDAAAAESVEAVKAAGKAENFSIFSCDGTEAILNYIANDDVQRGTIAFGSLGAQVADVVKQYIDGTRFDEPVFNETFKVTKENVADFQ